MKNNTKSAQEIIIEKNKLPPQKVQGYDAISTIKDVAFTEIEIVKRLKDVRNENQYRLLT